MEKLFIKNMVCDRCISSIVRILDMNSIDYMSVTLGEVILERPLYEVQYINLSNVLKEVGFEIVDSTSPVLVLKIKASLISLFGKNEFPEKFKLSNFLTQKFPYDYSHLSRVFSSHENDTIEQYLINLRIEKAKELLSYKERNIGEVAYSLGYASAAHFSRQFKKIVGRTPTEFQSNPSDRKSLREL
jgi:AraC-like DNA-binding protein